MATSAKAVALIAVKVISGSMMMILVRWIYTYMHNM